MRSYNWIVINCDRWLHDTINLTVKMHAKVEDASRWIKYVK